MLCVCILLELSEFGFGLMVSLLRLTLMLLLPQLSLSLQGRDGHAAVAQVRDGGALGKREPLRAWKQGRENKVKNLSLQREEDLIDSLSFFLSLDRERCEKKW